MIYVEAPSDEFPKGTSLFLGGGIQGTPDWQNRMKSLLSETDWVLYNPRRKNFPIDRPQEARAQIEWEHERLRRVDAILFWFPHETLCPIVLYELGAWSMTNKPLFVGCHPSYKRRQDVEIQSELVRPDIKVVYSLEGLAEQAIDFLKGKRVEKD